MALDKKSNFLFSIQQFRRFRILQLIQKARTTAQIFRGRKLTEYQGSTDLRDNIGYPLWTSAFEHNMNSYELASSPGEGMGLFATKSFKVGDLVIEERPIITASPLTSNLQRAVDKMSNANKIISFGLTDCHNPHEPTADTIMRTNALPLGEGAQQTGIFPSI